MTFSRDILKRDRDGKPSRFWYGREKTATGWTWVKLYEDEDTSRREWNERKVRAERMDAGHITAGSERLKQPLKEIVAEYHKTLRRQQLDADHVAISESMLSKAMKLGGWSRWKDLTVAGVELFLDGLIGSGFMVSYANKFVMRLKAFSAWATPEGHIDPLSRLSRRSEKGAKRKRARRAATQAELSALFELAIPYSRRLSYAFAAFNGLRRNEIRRLEWSDIDLESTPPTMKVRQKMGEHFDLIPIHPFVLTFLVDRVEATDLVCRAVPDVKKTMQKDWKIANVAFVDARGHRLDLHALRHTFSTAVNRAGANRAVQRMLMRHSHASVTDGYTHAELIEMSDILARVPWPKKKGTQMDHGTKGVRMFSGGGGVLESGDLSGISPFSPSGPLVHLGIRPDGIPREEVALDLDSGHAGTTETVFEERRAALLKAFIEVMERAEECNLPDNLGNPSSPSRSRIGGGK